LLVTPSTRVLNICFINEIGILRRGKQYVPGHERQGDGERLIMRKRRRRRRSRRRRRRQRRRRMKRPYLEDAVECGQGLRKRGRQPK